MNINAIQNHTVNYHNFNKMQKGATDQSPVLDPVQPAPTTSETEISDGGQKGALRLLQEGHFKSVADVRLRINFHDQIAAMENEQLKSVADGEIDKFITTITDFLESQELTEEDLTAIVDAFMAAAEKAKTDFLMEKNPSTDNLLDDIETAFEDLVAGLNDLIPETVAEAPALDLAEDSPAVNVSPEEPELMEEPAKIAPVVELPQEMPETPVIEEPIAATSPEEAEEDTTARIAQLIEAITSLYETAMGALTDTLSSSSVLPELSEPDGKGDVFEKFLNIYNELYGIGTAGEPTPSFSIEA